MKSQTIINGFIAALALGSIAIMPVTAVAQGNNDHGSRRDGQNRDWVKAGNGNVDTRYSSSQMRHDRNSSDDGDRARARIYGKKSFMHNGHRYIRHTEKSNGVVSFYFSIGG